MELAGAGDLDVTFGKEAELHDGEIVPGRRNPLDTEAELGARVCCGRMGGRIELFLKGISKARFESEPHDGEMRQD